MNSGFLLSSLRNMHRKSSPYGRTLVQSLECVCVCVCEGMCVCEREERGLQRERERECVCVSE